MFYTIKDPSSDLDYKLDWTPWLGTEDTIITSTWSAPANSGLTTHSTAVDSSNKITTVWVSGGKVNSSPYLLTNHIVTETGRQADRSISLYVTKT